ncbi:YigZ family protein [Ruminococcus flavefaciens]|uniref:YigZ family protein n=1 Tax=Ruminococcus flavefaciens TaxID=1265 RepID=UPI0026F20CA1|nr:YigZ family protein [Ruminococcus flavefaciens]MDD7516260.1 YigZ family protein [Ruminococcus flavefaciens]MDY5692508.1 YigZ family protein [Ruminococcus flavefaciens]
MNYFTISSNAKASFIEKRSEFIGYISPVRTNDEAVAFINSIKAEHRKAKHNVYAYILREDNISRYSDDGEPQGTAGVPVLDVLKKRGLTDVCVVVTRYFGGILLGGGGLVRAYSHAASLACDAAHIMNMCMCHRMKITADYGMYGKISYLLPNYDTITVNSDFGSNVTLEILVLSEKLDALRKDLVEVTNGSVSIEDCEELFEDFSSVMKNS